MALYELCGDVVVCGSTLKINHLYFDLSVNHIPAVLSHTHFYSEFLMENIKLDILRWKKQIPRREETVLLSKHV